MKNLKINLITAIISQFVAIIYGFILPRLILEHFGSEVNGLMQSITQFLGIIGFLDMGVGQVVRSSLYKPLQEHNNDQISGILVSGGRFYRKIAYALLGYVVILVMTYPFLVNESFDWVFTAGMIVIISISSFAQYYFGIIQEQLIHADQKNYLPHSIHIFCNLFNMFACVCLIQLNYSIHIVKLTTATIFLIKPVFYAWYIRKHYSINWRITYEKEPIKQKWHGITQHVSAVVLDGTDNIVLTLFATLSDVSIYSVYFMIVNCLQGFYQSALSGIQSAVGAVWVKNDEAEIEKTFSKIELCLHMVTIFLFCCAGFLIVPFVKVYTNGLADVNYIQPIFALILVIAYGIRCLRTPYNIWILAAGHFKQTQICHIVAAGLNLIISVLAVFRWGLIGVAIGTIIAMCYQTTWMMIYVIKNLVKCSRMHVIKQLLADIIAVGMISVLSLGISLSNISYLGWFFMATKIVLISAAGVIVTTYVFYPVESRKLIESLKNKLAKR